MIKVCTLLYYAHITKYNWTNFKCLRVLIMHICKLVRFHIQRNFCASLSVRVSNPGQPVTYTRKFCKNKPGHKIYLYMPSGSTRHYILLYNPKIIHTKTFLHQPVSRGIKYRPRQNCHIIHWYTHACFAHHVPLLNTIQAEIWVKSFTFSLI